jgi:hypothetical protein
MPNRFQRLDLWTNDMSKDSPEFKESIKNKFIKSRKSNPEEKGFGVILGIVV